MGKCEVEDDMDSKHKDTWRDMESKEQAGNGKWWATWKKYYGGVIKVRMARK